jgi:aminodeoxyfutalosine deaminase
MQFRKLKATKIFNGSHFLPADTALVIDAAKNRIEAILPATEVEDIEYIDGIISPAFVNTHCHIELSHLKNIIPEQTGLVGFIQQILSKREAAIEFIQASMQQAADELYQTGTIAVGDICNTNFSLPLKQNSLLHWHSFIELSGFNPAIANKKIEDGVALQQQFMQAGLPNNIVPHAPYSVSEKLFSEINNRAATLLSMHNQETQEEDLFFKEKKGDFLKLYNELGIDIGFFNATKKSSIQTVLPYLKNITKMLFVHNSFSKQEDIDAIQKAIANPIFCLCVNANKYIENSLPPIELLMQNNCNITLGTDSYASNTHLNMFEEIKTIQQNFPNISMETILQWATLNGAKALNIDAQYGSIEVGKKADLVHISGKVAKRIVL